MYAELVHEIRSPKPGKPGKFRLSCFCMSAIYTHTYTVYIVTSAYPKDM